MTIRAILTLAVILMSLVCIGSAQASNPVDIYPDNKVDWLDMKIMADNWLSTVPTPADIKVDGGIVYASSDISNSYPYCDMHSVDGDSQIDYSGGVFTVRTKEGRDMSDDPMVEVSWYGSVAYCNWLSSEQGYDSCYNLSTWECDFTKYGYRLPTEAQWEYAARGGEHAPYYRFPWGDTITHSQTNYFSDEVYSYDVSLTRGYHPNMG